MSGPVKGRTGGENELDLPRVRMQILAGRLAAMLIILAVPCLTVRAGGPKALRSRYSTFRTFRPSTTEPADPPKKPERSPATGTALFDPATDTWPVSTVANGPTTEEILSRLQAAEAEIRALRQERATSNGSAAAATNGGAVPDVTTVPGSDIQPAPVPTAQPDMPPAAASECVPPEPEPGPPVLAFLTPVDFGDDGVITYKPGFRVQSRYVYDDFNNNNDFFITRFRLKLGGDAFGVAKYYGELKFDSTGKFETEARGIVENAWLDFPLLEDAFLIDNAYLKVGLYDNPFSRDALTSDSKLLFMDRSLIKDELTEKGLADNTIGLLLHGRPCGGRFEYMWGVFDNLAFENTIPENFENTTNLMTAGRFVVNVLDPATPPDGYADYKASYVGEGQRLAIGTNYASLGDVDEEIAMGVFDDFSLYAWGVDIFYNCGIWVFQAEYDVFVEDFDDGGPNLKGDGWFVQGGCLLYCCGPVCLEAAARHQQRNPEDEEERLRWTSIGANLYIRDHNLKIQTEYTWKDERELEIDNDWFQIQLQFDY